MDALFLQQRSGAAATFETQVAIGGGGVPPDPVDTTPPVLAGALAITSVTAAGAVLSGPAATDATGVVGYEYSINGGTSYVSMGAARMVAINNLQPATAYLVRYRAFDAAGNRSAALSATLTTLEVQVPDFIPSVSRLVRILPGRTAFAVGSHWTLGSAGPVGPKDPNSVIDIPFDWSAWLADIGSPGLSKVEFFVDGELKSEGVVADANGGTVLVSGGRNGGTSTVTCRITTASTPPRTDDRTVVLQIREQ